MSSGHVADIVDAPQMAYRGPALPLYIVIYYFVTAQVWGESAWMRQIESVGG